MYEFSFFFGGWEERYGGELGECFYCILQVMT